MVTIHLKVQEVIDKKGWTQKRLSEETGLRRAAISEICNNLRTTINKEHLEKIAEVLGLNHISEIIELKVEQEG